MLCINCNSILNDHIFLCEHCGYLNQLIPIEYFAYFNLPRSVQVDNGQIEDIYLAKMQLYHPDRFVTKSADEHQNAVVHSAYLNDAYGCLLSLVDRFAYLYQLNYAKDINLVIENIQNSHVIMDFLALYEQVYELKTLHQYNEFLSQLQHNIDGLVAEFDDNWDDEPLVLDIYVKLRYLDKISKIAKSLQLNS